MKKFLIASAVCMAFFATTSCSNDDGGAPEVPKVKMAISSMNGGYLNQSIPFSINVKDIKYDAKGRVIGYTSDGEKVTYTYSDTKIVKTTDNNIVGEYVVKNGLIISDESGTYSYDSNNQLVSKADGGYSIIYKWENGNPSTMIEKDGSYSVKTTFEYSNEYNVLGGNFQDMTASMDFMCCDPFLCASGYFGKQPQNLLSKIYLDGEFDRSFTYSSPNAEGYPTKMEIVNDDNDIQEYTLSWVKI